MDLGPISLPIPNCTEWAVAGGILNPTVIGFYDNPVEAGLLERRQFEIPQSLRAIEPLCVKVTTIDETGRRSDSNVATVAP